MTDIVGGHVVSSISETGAALTLIQDGKLKALGITASTRHPQLPQVPTMAEALGLPGFEAVSWHVLMAPSATPRPDRGAPACRDDEHHRRCRLPEARQRGRPDAARPALDRRHREIHQERTRPLERCRHPARAGGNALAASGGHSAFGCAFLCATSAAMRSSRQRCFLRMASLDGAVPQLSTARPTFSLPHTSGVTGRAEVRYSVSP